MKLKAIALILISAALTAGCAKKTSENTVPEVAAMESLVTAFQLPVPDGSYSTQNGLASGSSSAVGTNVRTFMTYLDDVAKPLKESELHLQQVITQGQQINGVFHIVHSALNAELKGVKNDTLQQVDWTYTLFGKEVFKGTTSMVQGNGKVDMTQTGMHMEWNFTTLGTTVTRNLSVRKQNSGSGFLNFKITPTPAGNDFDVELVDGLAIGETVTGKWNVTGGFYRRGKDTAKLCWGGRPNLLDQVCVN